MPCELSDEEVAVNERIHLPFLTPKRGNAILGETTGQELTIKKLSVKNTPLDWNAQHAEFICKRP
jgi:hypothetical protein